MTPAAALGRFLAVVETGMGFGFLAGLISYLPVLYQAFSRRETTIALLDARAGSPPSAAQFLLRLIRSKRLTPSTRFSPNGNAGPPNCWRAIFRFRC